MGHIGSYCPKIHLTLSKHAILIKKSTSEKIIERVKFKKKRFLKKFNAFKNINTLKSVLLEVLTNLYLNQYFEKSKESNNIVNKSNLSS